MHVIVYYTCVSSYEYVRTYTSKPAVVKRTNISCTFLPVDIIHSALGGEECFFRRKRMKTRGGILRHKFDKRHEAFHICFSQSSTGGFLKNTRLNYGFENTYKKIRETRNLESTVFVNNIL